MLVVDASVLVELVIAGDHRAGADRLLDRYRADQSLVLVTAAHGLIEAASALRRLARGQALSVEDAAQAMNWLTELNLVLDPTGPRLTRVWQLRDTMSAYDAAYAAAAEALQIPLLTTDARLLAACDGAGIPSQHLREFSSAP